MHGGWKKTQKEAKAVQKAFLEARTKSGAHSFHFITTIELQQTVTS